MLLTIHKITLMVDKGNYTVSQKNCASVIF